MKLSQIRTTVNSHFTKPLVAVFIGGTQGIGNYTVETLAKICGTNNVPLTAYIVGRSAEKATPIIAKCTETCPKGQFTFIQAKDLTSIIDVDRVSKQILDLEKSKDTPRIDLLVLTQGQVLFGPRQETAEGLDRSMSLLYYSRIRFIFNLMPLMETGAHVISVYAAGMEAILYKDDLSLRDPDHYSFANCRSHCVHMKTMAFERIAKEHPQVSLTHVYPGLVLGPGFEQENPTFPLWFKVLWSVGRPLAWLLSTTPEDAGYIMLLPGTDVCPGSGRKGSGVVYASTDGVRGGGAYTVGRNAEELKGKAEREQLRSAGFGEAVWEHTTKVFDDIVTKGKFVG